MRHRFRLLGVAVAAAGALSVFASSALADSPAKSPAPVPGTPSCDGLIIAAFNHDSGADGPSGNSTASAGPGPFFGPGTHDAIQTLAREPNCTP
jgi:hypothetical protein